MNSKVECLDQNNESDDIKNVQQKVNTPAQRNIENYLKISKELFFDYTARQKFEHELINRRVTWLLTSQTILFAAYGLGSNKNNEIPISKNVYLDLIAICGLSISYLIRHNCSCYRKI